MLPWPLIRRYGGYAKVYAGKVLMPSGISDRYWYGVLEGS